MAIHKRAPSIILKDIIPSMEMLVDLCEPHLADGDGMAVLDALVDQISDLRTWIELGKEVDIDEPVRCNVSPIIRPPLSVLIRIADLVTGSNHHILRVLS
jgi:hypothetical protein